MLSDEKNIRFMIFNSSIFRCTASMPVHISEILTMPIHNFYSDFYLLNDHAQIVQLQFKRNVLFVLSLWYVQYTLHALKMSLIAYFFIDFQCYFSPFYFAKEVSFGWKLYYVSEKKDMHSAHTAANTIAVECAASQIINVSSVIINYWFVSPSFSLSLSPFTLHST